MLRSAFISTTVFCLLCFACNGSRQDLESRFLATSDAEESAIYAKEVSELGLSGIPIFNKVISASISNQDHLADYAKIMVSLKYLNNMAKEGVYSKETVPVLLNLIEGQRSIEDSLIAADTIKIITGLDVGYDFDFVQSYTPSDEPRRKIMIQRWREKIED